ncbi:phosphate acetyltransferase [Metamycoplasma alkalescens]|uniref:Phosphate acetyltransferase n=2 Tax=Metamycoplasma alkalescens TaxID=45363 RepID=N9UBA3_9BACT|nr:phosphate acetyltransferase [Metamycoplasma alkalescens]ENY54001.1 Phosphate acetyltransferase [Metamycoplasma alkalescens 14918]PYF42638.1 phosphate acetyltransferase [Metamycoplasma alkalescens]SYV90793.1 phosphate acetyltransferase [Metamycoplasma alkalescens]
MYTIQEIKNKLAKEKNKKRIVLPEGEAKIIQDVAKTLIEKNLGLPILVFKYEKDIPSELKKYSNLEIIALDKFNTEEFEKKFVEIRKGKATPEQATAMMKLPNYIGCMLVKTNQADCMLSGLNNTTADTIRPALQIIGTKPQYSIASTVLIMAKNDEKYIFTDCALNIKPTSEQLVDITEMAAEFAKTINVQNIEATLLSYSTNGSGKGEDVDRVNKAVQILKSKEKNYKVEGEIQFDAAFDKLVRDKKFKDNILTKKTPDIFVFPEIHSGNIGYKIAQRMGGYEAIGPFVLGLNQPVNDLSRGATFDDVLNTAIMTLFLS